MASIKQNTQNVTRRKTKEGIELKMNVLRVKATKDKQTRMEIIQELSKRTGLKRVEVEAVFTELAKLVKSHMIKLGSGEITVPKLGLKILKVRRKPTKKRTMVSPLTGKEVVIPPKPARDDIKLIALKGLKEALLA